MKRHVTTVFAALLALALLAGCATAPASSAGTGAASLPAASTASSQAGSVAESAPEATPADPITMQIAGLKGATTMGMVKLMADAEAGATHHDYQVTTYGTADEIVPKLTGGEIQIAAIPANLASVLYNNSGGKVKVAAINTLGVLYVVETGQAVQSVEDLRGKTLYSTGKGTTPEFALNYILEQNGLVPGTDLTVEFKSESTEIAALLAAGQDAIAVLPQPYVTAVQLQNEKVRVALDLTREWDKVSTDSGLVTGVLVVNAAWLQTHQQEFALFMRDYAQSIEWVNANVPEAAELVARYGIVEKAPVAEKALPACNIVYVAGPQMKATLSGYLQVLYNALPESVGGAMPDDAFYYEAAPAE